jgi:hypothetical protein
MPKDMQWDSEKTPEMELENMPQGLKRPRKKA